MTKTNAGIPREPCTTFSLFHIINFGDPVNIVIRKWLRVLACPGFCVARRLKLEPKTNKFIRLEHQLEVEINKLCQFWNGRQKLKAAFYLKYTSSFFILLQTLLFYCSNFYSIAATCKSGRRGSETFTSTATFSKLPSRLDSARQLCLCSAKNFTFTVEANVRLHLPVVRQGNWTYTAHCN